MAKKNLKWTFFNSPLNTFNKFGISLKMKKDERNEERKNEERNDEM
jgi:hypothetical protein